MNEAFGFALDRLRRAASGLPEVEVGSWYGTPALKVRGKGFCRVKDADTVVLLCAMEEKEILISAAPDIYFETDHYKGWPALLARIRLISDDELALRLGRAWCLKAPKSLLRDGPAG